MNAKQIRTAIGGLVDTLSQKNGVWTARREFFYTHGVTAQQIADQITAVVPGAVVTETAEVWKPFRGGASTACSSHWLVRFTVPVPAAV